MTERQCTICHETKPVAEFRRNNVNGFRCECRECERVLKRARRKQPHVRAKESAAYKAWAGAPVKEAVAKACSHCGVVKEPCDFGPHSKTADRLASWCKACVTAKMKERRQRKEVREREREYAKRPERLAQQRVYNKMPGAKASYRKYAESPKGKVSRAKRKALRRAREREMICTLTGEEWQAILDEHGHACVYCKRPFGPELKATMDHKIAVAKGGHHTKDNVVPACGPCNSSKKDSDRPLTLPEG